MSARVDARNFLQTLPEVAAAEEALACFQEAASGAKPSSASEFLTLLKRVQETGEAAVPAMNLWQLGPEESDERRQIELRLKTVAAKAWSFVIKRFPDLKEEAAPVPAISARQQVFNMFGLAGR